MIYIVIGKIGYGKTAYLTYRFLQRANAGDEVYSNYKINIEQTHILNFSEIAKIFDYEKVSIAIDEAGQYLDARRFQTKDNIQVSYLLNQSRKRKMNIYLSAQRFEDLDVRARTEYQIYVQVFPCVLNRKHQLQRATISQIFDEKIDYIRYYEWDNEGNLYGKGTLNLKKVIPFYDSFYYYEIGLGSPKKRKEKRFF